MEVYKQGLAGEKCVVTTTGTKLILGTSDETNAETHFNAANGANGLTFEVEKDVKISDSTSNPAQEGIMERILALDAAFTGTGFHTDSTNTNTWLASLESAETNLASAKTSLDDCHANMATLSTRITYLQNVIDHIKVPDKSSGSELSDCTNGVHYNRNDATGIGYFTCGTA